MSTTEFAEFSIWPNGNVTLVRGMRMKSTVTEDRADYIEQMRDEFERIAGIGNVESSTRHGVVTIKYQREMGDHQIDDTELARAAAIAKLPEDFMRAVDAWEKEEPQRDNYQNDASYDADKGLHAERFPNIAAYLDEPDQEPPEERPEIGEGPLYADDLEVADAQEIEREALRKQGIYPY
jgi:hypothetical protein